MKKFVLAAALPVFFASAAAAETMDMATVKCSELAGMSESDGSFMFTWLLGYAGGQSGDTTIDVSALEAAVKDIGTYCAANPDAGLLSAAKDALGD